VGVVPRISGVGVGHLVVGWATAPTARGVLALAFGLVRLGIFVGPICWGLVGVEFLAGGHHVSEVVVHHG
tara:strand:- start:1265 stop:1474 length:210 start_codon:yes stop_codon:yes gene_type:complete